MFKKIKKELLIKNISNTIEKNLLSEMLKPKRKTDFGYVFTFEWLGKQEILALVINAFGHIGLIRFKNELELRVAEIERFDCARNDMVFPIENEKEVGKVLKEIQEIMTYEKMKNLFVADGE